MYGLSIVRIKCDPGCIAFPILHVDVFVQWSWAMWVEVGDPELKELANALPSLALQGRAPATVKKIF